MTRNQTFVAALTAAVVSSAAIRLEAPLPWGASGHRMAAAAAVRNLPADMPRFFPKRAAQLVFLDPEPDRWRQAGMRAMDEAYSYDHYVDLERLPEGALEAEDRWAYLDVLYASGLDDPARDAGFLPFRILELHQRLVTEWRRWREADDPEERRWIEDRIIDDAGILGHYVTDASQPHHTTIHFNGWAEGVPNPEGFPEDRSFHSRFESAFVDAHVRPEHLLQEMEGRRPRRLEDVRGAIVEHILESHGTVEELYRLDRDIRFDPERSHPRTVAFTVGRLVSGAEMLQDLWWTAWLQSGG